MKNCAIICEYNPMHTGHAYQIDEAKKRFDHVICLMSGNFVQRAEPAVVERHVRAAAALAAGASLVAELPVIHATANGERFARGAVSTICELPGIDALVMGCEAGDPAVIKKLAAVQSDENGELKIELDRRLAEGRSYASALSDATATVAEKQGIPRAVSEAVLSGPNNLLCIEYLKSLACRGSKIEPVFIKRKGNGHNDMSERGNFLSATAIRELVRRGDLTAVSPYLGARTDETLDSLRRRPVDYELFSRLGAYALRTRTAEEIARVPDCREGLEYRLKECAAHSLTADEAISEAKSKRYTFSRLKRVVLEVMLGITREMCESAPYIPPRLLAIREDFKPYLAEAADKFVIRGSDLDRNDGEFFARYEGVERRAAALYSLLSSDPDDLYSPKRLFTI